MVSGKNKWSALNDPQKRGLHLRRPTHLTVALSMLSPALRLESSAFLVVLLFFLSVLFLLEGRDAHRHREHS